MCGQAGRRRLRQQTGPLRRLRGRGQRRQQAGQGLGAAQRVCFPAGVTATQMVAAVSGFLAAHPEKRPLAAQDLVVEALAAQYPCK